MLTFTLITEEIATRREVGRGLGGYTGSILGGLAGSLAGGIGGMALEEPVAISMFSARYTIFVSRSITSFGEIS